MKLVLTLCAAPLLAACATPSVVLEQARHTAGLAGQLELELKEFNRVQAVAADARLRSIARQEANIQLVAGQGRIAQAARAANGDTGVAKLQSRLVAVTTVTAEVDMDTAGAARRLDTELEALLVPLPSSSDKLLAAQKAVAQMGVELSPGERLAETRAFVKTIRESVEANRKKIDEAEAAAAAAEKANP
ncbi:hypothetical protein [Ramlibacter sp. AN1133]|uniref:hypothetical protein n=1 Tax=Ramlibacter sp. AN1133 TaxID=3133429 RepID=UPI0030C4F35F